MYLMGISLHKRSAKPRSASTLPSSSSSSPRPRQCADTSSRQNVLMGHFAPIAMCKGPSKSLLSKHDLFETQTQSPLYLALFNRKRDGRRRFGCLVVVEQDEQRRSMGIHDWPSCQPLQLWRRRTRLSLTHSSFRCQSAQGETLDCTASG